MGRIKGFLNTKIVRNDETGDEGCLTWRETLSYALGRGAQGMCTSMTSSKYVNQFIANILFVALGDRAMDVTKRIRRNF